MSSATTFKNRFVLLDLLLYSFNLTIFPSTCSLSHISVPCHTFFPPTPHHLFSLSLLTLLHLHYCTNVHPCIVLYCFGMLGFLYQVLDNFLNINMFQIDIFVSKSNKRETRQGKKATRKSSKLNSLGPAAVTPTRWDAIGKWQKCRQHQAIVDPHSWFQNDMKHNRSLVPTIQSYDMLCSLETTVTIELAKAAMGADLEPFVKKINKKKSHLSNRLHWLCGNWPFGLKALIMYPGTSAFAGH